LIQSQVKERITDTLKAIEEILSEYQGSQLDFIVLPEMFMCPYQIESFAEYSQNDESRVIEWLKKISAFYNSYVIGGSVPEKEGSKIFNTSYVFDRVGNIIKKYRKKHLFSVTYPNGKIFKESDTLSPGIDDGVFSTEFGKVGIMICFDVRFPDLAADLRRKGAKMIFIPAAFNTFTGPLHWETTFRARAIDNQLFVFGVSPSADSYGKYETYGHTIAVDPLGRIINQFGEQQDSCLIEVRLADIEEARNTIPIISS
jgi:predicted amidohydrolase